MQTKLCEKSDAIEDGCLYFPARMAAVERLRFRQVEVASLLGCVVAAR